MGYLRRTIFIVSVLILTITNSFALKAEYRFEDCNGAKTTQNFEGDSALDGKLVGDAKVDTGKILYGLNLNGVGGMFVPHNNELDLIENLTITFWVYPTKREREALIVKGAGEGDDRKFGSNAEYSIVLWEDGKIKYKHNGTADTYSNSILPLDKWTNVAIVRDNGLKSISIYINGKLDTYSKYTTAPATSNSEQLIIGSGDYYSDTMHNFQGAIDEIKIYNVGLSNSEIAKIYETENANTHYTKECQTHTAPEATGDNIDLPVSGTISIDVLENDKAFDSCELNKSSIVLYSDSKDANLSEDNRTLTINGEGVWSVDTTNGLITFVSDSNFYDNPTPIYYRVADSCGAWSNLAMITLTRVAVVTQPTPTPTLTPTPTATATPAPEVDLGSSTPTPTPIPTTSLTNTGVSTVGIPITTSTSEPDTNLTPTPTPDDSSSSSSLDNTQTPTPTATSTSLPAEIEEGFRLGDRVWLDVNANGIQDVLELGVEGVIVTLFDSNGQKIDTATTNHDGNYLFTGLSAGEYSLSFRNLPDGCSFTIKDSGSDDNNDSDVDENGDILNIKLSSDDLSNDAGLICQLDNNSTAEDCDCDDYNSSIPALNGFSIVLIVLLFGFLGFWSNGKETI